MNSIGERLPLHDGRPKVEGRLRYCSDLARPGTLHARFVSSPFAHAKINSIDKSEAESLAGVVRVYTSEDLPPVPPQGRPLLMLARERTMFVGQPVALVVAESESVAEDACETILVDYEPLDAIVTIEQALDPSSEAVWPEGLPGRSAEAAAHGADASAGEASTEGSPNIANRVQMGHGDVDEGFAKAAKIVEREFTTAGVHQAYIEPHTTLVDPDPMGSGMTIYTSTQATYNVREACAGVLGIDQTAVRVVGTPVGGGFGGKFVLHEPMLAIVARELDRPVALTMSRSEEMLAGNPAPATRMRLKLGMTDDGTLCALDAEFVMDNGCFPSSMAALGGILFGSNYKIEHQRIVSLEVLSHKVSSGAYRAPCAPQIAFALETAVDELAEQFELDPVAVREINACEKGDKMAMGAPWPGIGMKQVIETAKSHPVWRDRDTARASGRGVGFAIASWPGGTEPAAAACSLQPDGTVQVHVAHADITGSSTSLGMIAAEAFGVDADKVRIAQGDTASGPFAGSSGGSKTIYTMGPAVIEAAEEARRQTLELAAKRLEADPEDLEIQGGQVQVKGAPDKGVPLGKIAASTMRYGARQAPVHGMGRHAQLGPAPGFCAQLAEVSVDEDTGEVDVHKLIVIQDVGRAINPALVEGQMLGGALQGIGWALLEQMDYDDQGQLLSATFSDYAIPHVSTTPEHFEAIQVEVASDSGPYGARGVGEPPVVPTAAAIANAVADAAGVRLSRLPMSAPAVREALDAASG